ARDVVFALDVSRSMLAQDVVPSRLEVAKQGIRDALEVLGDHRVALVVYAGSASILCPLTYDHDFVRYMLDQAHPRSVAFGGTTLQSAVELAVDQIFMEDRKGGHDFVVLTDGADHGSNMELVKERLAAMEVDTLFVGLGDPEKAVPIPIEGRDGEVTYVEVDGETIYTRLKDAELTEIAASTERIDYFAAGTRPFHLGQVYRTYATDKSSPTVELESVVMVYREAAFFFMMPAFLLLLFSERWGARGLRLALAVGLLLSAFPERAQAAEGSFGEQFGAAVQMFEAGEFSEAEQSFRELYAVASVDGTSQEALAAVQFNLGLSLTRRSEAVADDSPGQALSHARAARDAFLMAKRLSPQMDRAGIRLVSMGGVIETLLAASATDDATQDRLQAMIERIQALWGAQNELREQSKDGDPRSDGSTSDQEVLPPGDAAERAEAYARLQGQMQEAGLEIQIEMEELNRQVTANIGSGVQDTANLLVECLPILQKAIEAQAAAQSFYRNWDNWPAARSEGLAVEHALAEILDLLMDRQSFRTEDEAEDEAVQDFEDGEEFSDAGESQSSSQASSADFAASVEMQALPVPNYSAEDILLEEQGSRQFREQTRARANAGQVERDY
ncbi:MAG: VWA domain-containing protein, partial [Puniceicoccaceae bacterium]